MVAGGGITALPSTQPNLTHISCDGWADAGQHGCEPAFNSGTALAQTTAALRIANAQSATAITAVPCVLRDISHFHPHFRDQNLPRRRPFESFENGSRIRFPHSLAPIRAISLTPVTHVAPIFFPLQQPLRRSRPPAPPSPTLLSKRKNMPKRLPQSDQTAALLYHARSATPFCSEDGQFLASVPSSFDSRHVLPLRSAAFRDWLIANFYAEFENAPSPDAIRSALRTLEAQRPLRRNSSSKAGPPPQLRRRSVHAIENHSRPREPVRRGPGNRLARLAHRRQPEQLVPRIHSDLALPRPASPNAPAARDVLDQFTNLCASLLPIAPASSPGSCPRCAPPDLTRCWWFEARPPAENRSSPALCAL